MTWRQPPRPTSSPISAPAITLPQDWSPDQALAVFEIVDLLRDHLWSHYGEQIQQALRLQQAAPAPYTPSDVDVDDSDDPF